MRRLASLRSAAALALIASAACAAAPGSARADDYDFGGSSSYGSSFGSSGGSFGSGSGFGRDRDRDDRQRTLSVGSGLAAPSQTAFFGENPAGLIYNRRPSFLGYVAAGPLHPDLISNGLSFMAGNGWAAASLGVQNYNNTRDSSGNITTFNFGAATYAEFINTALGLSGMYRFHGAGATDPAPGETPTWTADLGFLYNPYGRFRVGLNLYDLSAGMTAVGTGVAADVNRFSTLTLDASTDRHGRGLTLKPGLGVRAAGVHIAYSYGMQVDKSAASGITAGNTLGLGYEFNGNFRIDGYYNQVVPYFLGVTASF
jgi:hypothetical protein